MLLPIFTILATENHILSSSLLQFHHNLSPSLHSSHFHSIIHTKPHTFSSLLQFHHYLSAFFYSNSLPTPHYTLFPYLLLSNHPLISHYCTYCLHRYTTTLAQVPLPSGHKQTPSPPKNSYCLYNSVSPHEKSIRSLHFPPFHSTTCTALMGIGCTNNFCKPIHSPSSTPHTHLHQ